MPVRSIGDDSSATVTGRRYVASMRRHMRTAPSAHAELPSPTATAAVLSGPIMTPYERRGSSAIMSGPPAMKIAGGPPAARRSGDGTADGPVDRAALDPLLRQVRAVAPAD